MFHYTEVKGGSGHNVRKQDHMDKLDLSMMQKNPQVSRII